MHAGSFGVDEQLDKLMCKVRKVGVQSLRLDETDMVAWAS